MSFTVGRCLWSVDFEEAQLDLHQTAGPPEQFENVARRQRVQTLEIALTAHRVRLSRTRLSVGETRGHRSVEHRLDQRQRRVPTQKILFTL